MSTPLALALLGVGLVLIVSAYRDESPIDVVLIALGRGPATPAQLGAGGSTLGLSGGATSSTSGSSSSASSSSAPATSSTGAGDARKVVK